MKRHLDFWRLPAGRRFVETIRAGERRRRSILIYEPFDTAPLASAIADLTIKEGLDTLCEVDGSRSDGSLCEHLKKTFGNTASSSDGFAFDLNYAVILAWNITADSSLAADLVNFALSCAIRGQTSAPVVLFVSTDPIIACASPTWDTVHAKSILGPHDGVGFAASIGQGIQSFEQRLKTSVAVEVGTWDFDIVERILAMPTDKATRPDTHVSMWSDARIDEWRGTRASWAAGSLDHWGDKPNVHPLLLASNEPHLLTKRVWRGQIAVLFPWLEEYRQAAVRSFKRLLRPDERSYGDQIDTLDWGPICWQLGKANISTRILNAIHAGRKLRNDLAHGRPVDWADVQGFESRMAGINVSP